MSGMDRLTEADREQITNAAYEAHRNWCRGARGQMISEWDSIESWIAVETAAFLARRASQAAPAEEWEACTCGPCPLHPAAPAPSDGLREAWIAGRDAAAAEAFYACGCKDSIEALTPPALSASPAQEGGK